METMQKACDSLMRNGVRNNHGSVDREGMRVSVKYNGKEYSQRLTWTEINAAYGRALANNRQYEPTV